MNLWGLGGLGGWRMDLGWVGGWVGFVLDGFGFWMFEVGILRFVRLGGVGII